VLHDIGNALVGFGAYLNRINRALDKNNINTVKNLDLFVKSQKSPIANAIGNDKATALVAITDSIVTTQTENKAEIGNSVNELLNIITHIQEILNIQRQFVRDHGGVHERKHVNLANIIDDCKAMLLASFEKKGIQLKIDIGPGSYIIKGDHTKLMQVILNVLKNSVEAIDFEAPEKKITVSLAEVSNAIELRVTDNGQGFDEKTGKHFFERGFTTKKSGTGLGLYNCRSIVESHAGVFEIKSDGPSLGAVTLIKFSI
jgi:signal transduction histidine kinase